MEFADLNQALGEITRTASENSAWSAQQAQIQREWQEQQNAKAMNFNANEAAKNRDWQQMMSNTAHQREIADLKAAGLNPVLSAMNGNGAAVTSGATASGVSSQGAKGDRDTSANSAIVGLLGSFLNTQAQLEAANINARTQEAVADKYAAVDALAARLSSDAARYSAGLSYDAQRYGVDNPNTLWGIVRALGVGALGSDSAKGLGGTLGGLIGDLINFFTDYTPESEGAKRASAAAEALGKYNAEKAAEAAKAAAKRALKNKNAAWESKLKSGTLH